MNALQTMTIAPTPANSVATARKTATKRLTRTLSNAKKPRKSRRKYDFKPDFLAQFFHMPQREAAIILGVAVITIKRNCKRYKIEWPYRANKYKYKAQNQVPMSEKGLAFMNLPLSCMNEGTEGGSTDWEMANASECETDTESVDVDDDQECSEVLLMLHKSKL
ncbi:hypothetical protein PHYBOEH_006594 [Phytophthora boehmeriae]|uniref:RWP-RK domain-containing protein n=1 Tax=Phytophthora boehmeriae TaxID=109152 RepID=A0A8T1WF78_9STRA|nr:hypothetical protein PHYBOEH_006594 [Phytophthora boehmeriae]